MKNKFRLMTILAATAITPLVLPAVSPSGQFAVVAQTADEEKTKLYTDFYNAVTGNGNVVNDAAYQIGKQYLAKFGTQTDQYTQYIKAQVEAHEKSQKTAVYVKFFTEARNIYDGKSKNFDVAFTEGRGILAKEPQNLNVLINLARLSYLANAANNKQFNSEGIGYATKAIQMFDAGTEPVDFNPDNADTNERYSPFINKQDAIAFMHFTLGDLTYATSPQEAARHYTKAASYDSFLKKEPSTYSNLAGAYSIEYDRLSKDFERYFKGQPESPESIAALNNLNQIIDRLMDAQARVVAYSTDARYQQLKADAQKQLTTFYEFRNKSQTGLPEYIAGITSKPLPEPVTVTITAPVAPVAPAATGTAGAATTPTNGATTPTATPSPRPSPSPAAATTRPRN